MRANGSIGWTRPRGAPRGRQRDPVPTWWTYAVVGTGLAPPSVEPTLVYESEALRVMPPGHDTVEITFKLGRRPTKTTPFDVCVFNRDASYAHRSPIVVRPHTNVARSVVTLQGVRTISIGIMAGGHKAARVTYDVTAVISSRRSDYTHVARALTEPAPTSTHGVVAR